MGRIENDKTGDNEKQIDATAAIGQREGEGAVGHREALRRSAEDMKGDHREGGEKAEDLDINEHAVPCVRRTAPQNKFVWMLRFPCVPFLIRQCRA
jgi:hypothetical protein